MKLEWEAEEKAKAAGMAVNHVMKYQNAGAIQGPATTISLPIFPAFGTHACVPPTAVIHAFGVAAVAASSHAHAASVGICAFVAEPSRPPSNALRPDTPTTSTKARGPRL
jgi:hypothetical protein